MQYHFTMLLGFTADGDINNVPACSLPADGIRTQLWLMFTLVQCLVYAAVPPRYLTYTIEMIQMINKCVTNIL